MTTTHTLDDVNEDPVQRLVDAIAAGAGIPDGLFAADAVFDATVPHWRFATIGAPAIGAELAKWYKDPATIDNVVRRPITGGAALELEFSWEDEGVPHAAHQLHVLIVDGSTITRDTVWCGGRWGAELLAEMEAAGAR